MKLNIKAQTVMALVKGVAVAMLVTLSWMAVLALFVVRFGLSDSALTALNQVAKICSIFVGALLAIGRGGEKGFATGAAVGLMYMVLGYALYCLLDGALLSFGLLAGEFAMGALLGAISGAVVANLKPSSRKKRARVAKRFTRSPAA